MAFPPQKVEKRQGGSKTSSEKYGFSALERPDGQVLRFHALSVGESLALLPLVDRALANDAAATVVLTTSTVTSVAALEKAGLPDRAVHVLLPIDTVQAVRRFLDHWRPTVAVLPSWTSGRG